MTYLVQKTNMFKQKMKIDDNIICNKMLTVQLWYICPQIALLSIVLTEFVMYYPRRRGNNFRWRVCLSGDCVVAMYIRLDIWTVTAYSQPVAAAQMWHMAASPLFLNTNAIFVGLSAMISHVKICETCCRSLERPSLSLHISGQELRVGLAVVIWAHGHAEVCVDGIASMGRASGRVGMRAQHGVTEHAMCSYPQRTCILLVVRCFK